MKRVFKILRTVLVALVALIGVLGYGWLLWKGPWYFDRPHLRKRDLQPADGVVITGFRTMMVALGAGVVTAIGLWYTSRNHRLAREQFTQTQEQFKLSQHQFEHAQEQFAHTQKKDREQADITREGQVTDRYVEAIKLLGSANLAERLGGIYSLERIMNDSKRDAKTVIEVLAAFVRSHSSTKVEEVGNDVPPNERITEEVQAAITVLTRRPENTKGIPVSLIGAKLRGVQLESGDLTRWDMRSTDLSQANLQLAQATGAHLEDADLEAAYLYRTDLEGAYLSNARLTGTNLWGAKLREATLFHTDLSESLNLGRQQILEAHITFTTTLPSDMELDEEIQQRMSEGEWVANSRDPYNV
ncbi:pentapeptide repeat-containing protein [Streptomyces sp. BV286]|uniref:pentapeptide repeat-containing protein n=1 Tax=Streptomyces sp. BV286 TaxID=2849672 RepID=UPI001C2EF4BF|nr:pentapeptide repeat-containing protein [Streptomyces sp. BV286]MBV1939893.1 pentapeptide repeat-containing protein [Streptomyces sp. BV286]